MTRSLLDRQLASITNILRETERRGANPRGLANKHPQVTPAGRNEGSDNTDSIQVRATYKDSERTATASQSEGMHMKQHVLPSGKDAKDMDDPRRMLNELERDSQDRHAGKENTGFDSLKHKHMSGSVATTNEYDAVGDSPEESFQGFNQHYSTANTLGTGHNETSHLTGSKAMLADIKEERQALGQDACQSTESVLEAAFERLTTTNSPSNVLAPQHTLGTNEPMPASYATTTTCRYPRPSMVNGLDLETIPYAVALMLESAGCKWEEVMGWTLYLFSSNMDEYMAKQEEEQKIKEKEVFDAVMARFLAVEEKRRAVEKKPFATRIVLSNLAADVDRKSIYRFFSKYQRDICKITLLPERDPIKRTRMAYVDMSSRTAAVCASFEFGYIFGLKVEMELAVE